MKYQIGGFTLDTSLRELFLGDEAVVLAPKEFDLLLQLAEANGAAVSRDVLMQRVWPDTTVGDNSLARCISSLRKQLGTEAITVVPKFGYRLTLPVRKEVPAIKPEVDPVLTPSQTPNRTKTFAVPRWPTVLLQRRWGNAFVVSASIVGALLVAVLFRQARVRAATPAVSPEAAYWDSFGVTALNEGTYFKASKAFEHARSLAPQAAIVHLHLAQAALMLDFVETAQKELLIAESAPDNRSLSALDCLRLDALRAQIVQDYATTTQKYEQAVAESSGPGRAALLEELGVAYTRQGQLAKAEESFAGAAQLAPFNPGPELALGKLGYLQRKWSDVSRHYDRAAQLFEAASNPEGTAEVYYQRSLVAYVQAKYAEEENWLKQSMAVASDIADPNLKLRCLGGFSTMYRWSGHLDLSQQYALEETQMATQSGSQFFYAAGIMHQANVAVARHDREASKRLLQQAVDLAARTGNARQQANAEFTLAQFSGDNGDYEQEIVYANKSLAQYRAYGSVDGMADAQLLRIEGETHSAKLSQALADAQTLLASSEATHSDLFTEDTEVALGEIYSHMKNEPEALTHFLKAQEWSRRTGSQPELKTLHVAGSYARLGRWNEAKAVWATVPPSTAKDPDSAATYAEVKAVLQGK